MDGSADAILTSLRRGGFQLGLDQQLRIVTLLAELAARGADFTDRDLVVAHLTPLVAKEAADVGRVHAAFYGTRVVDTPRPEPAGSGRAGWPLVGSLRRIGAVRFAVASAIVLLLALLAWQAPRIVRAFRAPTPAEDTTAPTSGPYKGVSFGDLPATLGAPDGARPLLKMAFAIYAGGPTLTELFNDRVFGETPELVGSQMGLSPDQPLTLADTAFVDKLLHYIAPGSEASMSAVAADVAATPRDDPRETELAAILTPSRSQPEIIAPVLTDMAQKPWTTAELAAWAHSIDPKSVGISDDRVARIIAARAAVHGQALNLSDPPWGKARGAVAAPVPPAVKSLRSAAPLLAAVAASLLGVAAWLAAAARLRAFLERRRPLQPMRLIELILQRRDPGGLSDEALKRVASRLSRQESRGSTADVRASVLATARNAGLFTVVRREHIHKPEYLFLIDSRSRTDHLAQQFRGLLGRLARQGVNLRWMFFERWPDRVRGEVGEASRSLARVASRESNRLLVLIGDATDLVMSADARRSRWFRLVSQWRDTAVFSTAAPETWGRAEQVLARRLDTEIDVFDPGALDRLADRVTEEGEGAPDWGGDAADPFVPVWLATEAEIWTSERAPADDLLAALDRDLRRELGYHGIRWLQACAVYPTLNWRLSEALGASLRDHADAPVATPARAMRLARLPWMRLGEMPEWLRGRLIDRMEPDDAATVRARISELLDRASVMSGADEAGGLAIGLDGGVHPYTDKTFARFVLKGGRGQRGVEASRRLRRLLDTSLERRLAHPRALAWLSLAAIAAAAAGYGVRALRSQAIPPVMLFALAALAAIGAVGMLAAAGALAYGLRRPMAEAWRRLRSRPSGPEPRRREANLFAWSEPGPGRFGLVLVTATVFLLLGLRTAEISLSGPAPIDTPAPVAPTGARATLADRNGVALAVDAPAWTVQINPLLIGEGDRPKVRTAVLAALKGVQPSRIDAVLNAQSVTPRIYVLERQAGADEVARLRAAHVRAIEYVKTVRRDHPNGASAAQFVGLTDVDGRGLSGAELALDSVIRARIYDGTPIRLSLDLRHQKILDGALAQAVRSSRAIGAAGVVLDARTGEILAMTSLPSFDPNDRSQISPSALINRAVTSVYEFGGVWAPIVSAVTTPPVVQVGGTSASAGSAPTNPIAAGLNALGLLGKAPVELTEAGTPLAPRQWTPQALAALKEGMGIAVPALNMAVAGAAVDTGGYVPPTILPQARAVLRRFAPSAQWSAPDAAFRALPRSLDLKVSTGFAPKAERGGYSSSRHIASVLALFSDQGGRRIAAFMLLDEPEGADAAHTISPAGAAVASGIGALAK